MGEIQHTKPVLLNVMVQCKLLCAEPGFLRPAGKSETSKKGCNKKHITDSSSCNEKKIIFEANLYYSKTTLQYQDNLKDF